jgi:signal transduction histidine kinase
VGSRETTDPRPIAPQEARAIARAVALCELTFGLSHALNNAFTAIVGEASYLQGEPKEGSQVDEACSVILEQVERCAQMTRALLVRRPPLRSARAECDLVRVVRDTEGLLRDALSRRIVLRLETPEEPLVLPIDPADAETLLFLLVQRAARAGTGPLRIVVRAEPGDAPDEARLDVFARPESVGPDGGWRAPKDDACEGPAESVIRSLTSALGVRCCEREAPGEVGTCVRLPRVVEA